MAKIALYKIDENGERVEKKLDESKAAVLPELIKRGWKRVGIIPEAPAAPVAAAAPEMPAAPTEPETTATGLLGAFARGAAPIAGGAVLGGALAAPSGVGIPFGIAAGAGTAALTQLLADPAMGFINWAAGTDYPMPSKAFTDFLTQIGVPEPDTAAERLVQQFAGGAAAGAAGVGAGRMLMGPAMGPAPTIAQRVGQAMAAQPAAQVLAGGAAGLGGQAAAELGAGPEASFLASLAAGAGAGGLAAGKTLPAAGPYMTRVEPSATPMTKAQTWAERAANEAMLKKAGPDVLEKIKKGILRGVDEKEAARIMREQRMGGFKTPEDIAGQAAAITKESGSLLGQIRAEVDRQASGFMEKAGKSRAIGREKQKEFAARFAEKMKAAEEASTKAAELERMAADAAKRLADEQAELQRAGTTTGVARELPSSAAAEPGVLITTGSFQERVRKDLQKAAQEAADGVSQKMEAAKEMEASAAQAEAAAEAERAAMAAELSPAKRRVAEPMLGAMMDPSKTATFAAQKAKEQAAVAARDAAVALQQFRQTYAITQAGPPAPLPEGQVPMRALVSARKSLQVRQREVDMMAAAAKKAREDAARLTKEATPTSYEHAQSQMDIIEAERLGSEAEKRMVSGKDVAEILRRSANSIERAGELGEEAITAPKKLAVYKELMNQANTLEKSGMMTLEQAQEKINGLRETAKFEKSPLASPEVTIPKAEAAKEAYRALTAEQYRATGEAAPSTEAFQDILSQRLSRVGRGKSIERTPTPQEALGSLRRSYAVMSPLEESAKKEAARVAELSFIPSPVKKGELLPPRIKAAYAPSLKSEAYEKLTSVLGAPGEISPPVMEQIARPGVTGSMAQAYLDMLDAIQKSYEPENPEEQMTMVNP